MTDNYRAMQRIIDGVLYYIVRTSRFGTMDYFTKLKTVSHLTS